MLVSHFLFLSILLARLCVLNIPFTGTVHFVDADAAGNNNGTSWAHAFQRLDAAILAANPGDTLWIAEGSYRPTQSDDRSVSFRIQKPLALYGGFQGTEASLQERDPASFITRFFRPPCLTRPG